MAPTMQIGGLVGNKLGNGNIEYILKIQQGEVNKLEFSKFSNLILRFFVRERIKITQTPNE